MKLRNKKYSRTDGSRQRGSAMLLVIMMSVFTMGIWAVNFRSTRDAIETEGFHKDSPYFEGRIVNALAFAGRMLENEKLAGSRYQFLFTGQDDRGRFFTTVELFKGANGKIEARAYPASDQELRGLPRNPASFQ